MTKGFHPWGRGGSMCGFPATLSSVLSRLHRISYATFLAARMSFLASRSPVIGPMLSQFGQMGSMAFELHYLVRWDQWLVNRDFINDGVHHKWCPVVWSESVECWFVRSGDWLS
jgi:hypothetical protein